MSLSDYEGAASVAEAAGFRLNEQGQFDYLHEETGKLQFSLTNFEPRALTVESLKVIHTHGITLLLDVPRVADPVRAFDQMRIVAKRLDSPYQPGRRTRQWRTIAG